MNQLDITFERIYRTYYRRVYEFLYKQCHDAQLSAEMTQNTFCTAYGHLMRYSGECEMFTWLAALAKNELMRYIRTHSDGSLFIDLYVTVPDAPLNEEPGYRVTREVTYSELRRAFDALPPRYTETAILRIYGEISYEEIARMLDISQNTAKVIFFRATKMLKEILIHD